MWIMLFFIHFTWSWVYYGTWQLDATHMLKLWQLKLHAVKPVSSLWASWTLCYSCWVRDYLRLSLHFIWIKIPDGYQIAILEKSLGLCSTSQSSLWIWSFCLKNEVSFCYLLSKVISFILSSFYISIHGFVLKTGLRFDGFVLIYKHSWSYIQAFMVLYTSIHLELFVAICEIWLPGLTYSVYLVLFLKPGATKWYQSNADCRTQA